MFHHPIGGFALLGETRALLADPRHQTTGLACETSKTYENSITIALNQLLVQEMPPARTLYLCSLLSSLFPLLSSLFSLLSSLFSLSLLSSLVSRLSSLVSRLSSLVSRLSPLVSPLSSLFSLLSVSLSRLSSLIYFSIFVPVGICCFPPPCRRLRTSSQGPPVPRTARTNPESMSYQGRRRPRLFERVRAGPSPTACPGPTLSKKVRGRRPAECKRPPTLGALPPQRNGDPPATPPAMSC